MKYVFRSLPSVNMYSLFILFLSISSCSTDGSARSTTRSVQGATRVEIFFDVPSSLKNYTGSQPVTFGIPFSPGLVKTSHRMKVVDIKNKPVPAQFEVTSTWGPKSSDVRWLLVDMIVPIKQGSVGRYFFKSRPGRQLTKTYKPMNIDQSRGEISINTGGQSFVLNGANGAMGHFILSSTNGGKSKDYKAGQNGNYRLSLETHGPVRTVAKMTGSYTAPDGETRGQFITRVRAYAKQPYVRVYHTMIWDEDDTPVIDSLRYHPTHVPSGRATAGIDNSVVGPASNLTYRQHDWNIVHDGADSTVGTHLDGWVQVDARGDSLFAGVRWPWQQHPLGFSFQSGDLAVNLINPKASASMSMVANDLVIPALKDSIFSNNINLITNQGPYNTKLSPRGVGKTYEILIWRDDDTTPQNIKNILLQHPIYAYPDPKFATLADLPTPVSPVNTTDFPMIEAAIENSFEWLTREDAEDGDFGIWNFGDIQYDWSPIYNGDSHYNKGRYWMNNGKGFNGVPWLLFLRSGARKYLEFAEARSRHLMDVDTCHITNTSELKFKGGTHVYAPLHFGHQNRPVYFTNESSYLMSYYHMTGYERAKDIIGERVEALTFTTNEPIQGIQDIQDMLDFLKNDYQQYPNTNLVAKKENNYQREPFAVLGDLAILYEATFNPKIKAYADQYIDLLVAAQASNGYVSGVKTNLWFAGAINHAQRAFPARRTELRNFLQKWQEFVGNYKVIGNTGEVGSGTNSLWSMLIVGEHTGNSIYTDLAIEYARTGSMGVYDNANEWLGYSLIPRHELGQILVDWVAALDTAEARGPNQVSQRLAEMTHFNAGLTTQSQDGSSYTGRHVFYLLEETDQTITVDISFNQRNAGLINQGKIRVFAPDETESEITRVIETRPGGLFDLLEFSFPSPFDVEDVSQYQGTFQIQIPPDGQTGAYAIEVLNGMGSPNWRLPVHARSSTGKLVHYLPQYSRRAEFIAPHDLFYTYNRQQQGSVSNNNGWGGQVFFKPKSTCTPVEFGFGHTLHDGAHPLPETPTLPGADVRPELLKDYPRIVTLDSTGAQVCASQITGTTSDGLKNPIGTSCTFTPSTTTLHSMVTLNQVSHYQIFMDGVEPFFAGHEDQWFDPRNYTHPDPTQFLVPRD